MNQEELLPVTPVVKKVPSSLSLFLEAHGIPRSAALNILWIAGTLVASCLAIAAVSGYRHYSKTRKTEASTELLKATTAANLDVLMKRFGSSELAPVIMLKLAQAQYTEGSYELARRNYQLFQQKYPKHEFIQVSELGLILCDEALPEGATRALESYKKFLAGNPDSFLAPEAVFGSARCLEQLGRLEEARQVYEDFKVGQSDSVWKDKVEKALVSIEMSIKRKEGKL